MTMTSFHKTYDVVVAGAGIAGATAARLFAQRGYTVLLVEQQEFPRYKVCGSCLNGRSVAYLKQAGIDTRLISAGAQPIRELALYSQRHTARLGLHAGMAVSRSLLDSTLVDAACESGAQFVDGHKVLLGPVRGDLRQITLQRGSVDSMVTTRLAIAAGGLQGLLIDRTGDARVEVAPSSRIGLGTMLPEAPPQIESGQIHMACAAEGYVGLVRVENDQLVIASALDQGYIRRSGGPASAISSILHASGIPAIPDLANATWKGTPPLTRRATRHTAERVLVLGDAGSYVEPFTGEGMAWALESAHAADLTVNDRLGGNWAEIADAWERAQRKTRIRQRFFCMGMAGLLRSPRATSTLISILSRSTLIARPIIRRLNATPRS